jgi:hypothetical protein
MDGKRPGNTERQMMPENSSYHRQPIAVRSARLRSAVTNRKRLFVEGDGRSPWARRWRDLVELHAGDLGGMDLLSEAQLSLIKRASTIEVELEQVEGRLSSGRDADLDLYTRSASHHRRILETLGHRASCSRCDAYPGRVFACERDRPEGRQGVKRD